MTDEPPDPAAAVSGLAGLRLVTVREISQRGRSVAYLLSVGLGVLLLSAVVLLPQLLSSSVVTHRVGHVGSEGLPTIEAAGSILLAALGSESELDLQVRELPDEEAARAALEQGEVELVLLGADRILREGSPGLGGSEVQAALQQAASLAQLDARLAGTGVTVEDLATALRDAPLAVQTLVGDTDAGVEEARSLIAYGGMMLLYMAILGSARGRCRPWSRRRAS